MKDKEETIEEIWTLSRISPPFLVSNLGRVKDPNKDNQLVLPRNGTRGYLRFIFNPKYLEGKKFISNHRIVANEFVVNDSPETKKQINHKDGNKLNNAATNLEWSTGSHNVQHSLHNNLRSDNLRIKVKDIIDNKVYKYISINDFHSNMESDTTNTPGMYIPQDTILSYVYRTQHQPYLGRYVIELEDGYVLNNKYNTVVINAYNHMDNKWYKFISFNHISLATGLKGNTVMDYVNSKPFAYYGGYTFTKLNKDINTIGLKDVTPEQAKLDYDKILSIPLKLKHKGYVLYDYLNKKEHIFTNPQEAGQFIHTSAKNIMTNVYRSIMNNRTWLVNGWGIKTLGSDLEWVVRDKEEIMNSKLGIKFDNPIFIVDGECVLGCRALADKINVIHNGIIQNINSKEKLDKYMAYKNVTVSVSRLKFEE